MLNFWTGFRVAAFSYLGYTSVLCGLMSAFVGMVLVKEGFGDWTAWLVLALAVPFLPAFCEGVDFGSVIPRNVSNSSGLAAAYTIGIAVFVLGMYVVLPTYWDKLNLDGHPLPLLQG